MTVTGYRRVSKRRPCGICGKPDWCSTTATETISFCARSTLNADRVSRYGWGVYYHERYRSPFDFDFKRNFNRIPKRTNSRDSRNLAPPTVQDRVYRKLVELSPASSSYEIVNGRGGLSERRIKDLSQYGRLPRTVDERRVLVGRLIEAQAKEKGDISFEGIPGFWKNAAGEWRLWNRFDSNDELLLIPFIGRNGLIQACQIRFMRYVEGRSGNYVWLSSAKERLGSSPGSHLHHVRPRDRFENPVLVTEGALKAATAQRFLTDRYVVGNSGVATAHREVVEAARGRRLEIAFDNDSFTNPHVARALAALVRHRQSDQFLHDYNEEVRVVTWDRSLKGIDEALLTGASLQYLTVSEWLKQLKPECFEQAREQLSLLHRKSAAGRRRNEPFQRTEEQSSHCRRADCSNHRCREEEDHKPGTY